MSLLVFVATAIELTSTIIWSYKRSNLFLLHVYTLFEFEIISFYYFMLFKKNGIKALTQILMFGFLIFSFVDAFFLDGLNHFNTYTRSIECIIIMFYAVYYLYKQLVETQNSSNHKNPILLINTAFLFYFSVSLFLFLISNYIMKETTKTYMVWTMHTIVAWIYYTTIGIALWKAGRK